MKLEAHLKIAICNEPQPLAVQGYQRKNLFMAQNGSGID